MRRAAAMKSWTARTAWAAAARCLRFDGCSSAATTRLSCGTSRISSGETVQHARGGLCFSARVPVGSSSLLALTPPKRLFYDLSVGSWAAPLQAPSGGAATSARRGAGSPACICGGGQRAGRRRGRDGRGAGRPPVKENAFTDSSSSSRTLSRVLANHVCPFSFLFFSLFTVRALFFPIQLLRAGAQRRSPAGGSRPRGRHAATRLAARPAAPGRGHGNALGRLPLARRRER